MQIVKTGAAGGRFVHRDGPAEPALQHILLDADEPPGGSEQLRPPLAEPSSFASGVMACSGTPVRDGRSAASFDPRSFRACPAARRSAQVSTRVSAFPSPSVTIRECIAVLNATASTPSGPHRPRRPLRAPLRPPLRRCGPDPAPHIRAPATEADIPRSPLAAITAWPPSVRLPALIASTWRWSCPDRRPARFSYLARCRSIRCPPRNLPNR